MFIEYKTPKDSIKDIRLPTPNFPLAKSDEKGGGLSYTKTDKLVVALYMVTDIIDRDEPLRNKLRTLGAEIISDIHTVPLQACSKINQVMSFLGLASTVNIISEMNCGILKKEFSKLDQSIKELNDGIIGHPTNQINLTEFFSDESESKGHFSNSIGHKPSMRIGVQKGSTLMKVLSDKTRLLSDNVQTKSKTSSKDFDILKQKRRENITSIIKNNGGSASIKDIRTKVGTAENGMPVLSEKTLQRELMSMTKDGVLNKTGEKRWSRYLLTLN